MGNNQRFFAKINCISIVSVIITYHVIIVEEKLVKNSESAILLYSPY